MITARMKLHTVTSLESGAQSVNFVAVPHRANNFSDNPEAAAKFVLKTTALIGTFTPGQVFDVVLTPAVEEAASEPPTAQPEEIEAVAADPQPPTPGSEQTQG